MILGRDVYDEVRQEYVGARVHHARIERGDGYETCRGCKQRAQSKREGSRQVSMSAECRKTFGKPIGASVATEEWRKVIPEFVEAPRPVQHWRGNQVRWELQRCTPMKCATGDWACA